MHIQLTFAWSDLKWFSWLQVPCGVHRMFPCKFLQSKTTFNRSKMSLSIWALHWLDAHMLSIWQPSTVLEDAMIERYRNRKEAEKDMMMSEIMYPYTQWFCWSLSLLNGYFIGNINPTFSDTPILKKLPRYHKIPPGLWWSLTLTLLKAVGSCNLSRSGLNRNCSVTSSSKPRWMACVDADSCSVVLSISSKCCGNSLRMNKISFVWNRLFQRCQHHSRVLPRLRPC